MTGKLNESDTWKKRAYYKLGDIMAERENNYGSFAVHAKDVAYAWSNLTGHDYTPKLVAMMMIQFKMLREPTEDTLLDIAGYALLASELDNA